MKRLLLLAMLTAWLGGALYAQSLYSLDALTQGIVENLDKTELQTGILLQQAPLWVIPSNYDGQALHDSNFVNSSTFGRLFGQLRAAAVGTSVLPEPAVYLDELARLHRNPGDTVRLALLAMQYEYIHKDAFAQGLLVWGSNNKIDDVSGRTASPYHRDTTFAFAAMTGVISGRDFIFQMPSKFVFSNLGWPIDTYEVDFSDGRGWQRLNSGQCIAVRYPHSGVKSITLRLHDGQRYWQSHTRLPARPPLCHADRREYFRLLY